MPGTGGIPVAQTAHGLSVGDVIRHNGTDYVVAQANDSATSDVVGVVSTITDANNFVYQQSGLITLAGLTAGEKYYLSQTVAGGYQTPAPEAGIQKEVFSAISATSALVNIDSDPAGREPNTTPLTAMPANAIPGIYNVDTSGGAWTYTLPAATGSQVIYEFIANDVETNDMTFAVQTGEYINNSLNATYVIQSIGERVQIIDRATGRWELSVLGATTTALKWAQLNFSSDTGNTTPVQNWNVETQDSSNTFTVGGTNNDTITGFEVGKRYQINFSGRYLAGAVTATVFRFEENSTLIQGSKTFPHSMSNTSDDGSKSATSFVYEPTVTTGLQLVRESGGADGWASDVSTLSIVELPSTETVLAGMAEVTTLDFAMVSERSVGTNNSLQQIVGNSINNWNTVADDSKRIELGGATTDIVGSITVGTHDITIGKAGRYEINAVVPLEVDANDNYIQLVKNGTDVLSVDVNNTGANTPGSFNVAWQGDLAASDTIDVRCGSTATNNIQVLAYQISIVNLPDTNAVLPDSVVVDDQASSGYFDIGDMRMQWGTGTGAAGANATIALPAAFGSTAYQIGSTISDLNTCRSVSVANKTTTTFDAAVYQTNTFVKEAVAFEWVAIGLKP